MFTLTLIKSALWVLFFETLQNIPSMFGMVWAMAEKSWKKYLYAFGGMVVCAFFIAALENTKLLGTTIAPSVPTLQGVVTYGVILGIGACIYVFLTQWGNKWSDTAVGVALAVATSVSSFKPDEYWSVRFFSHTIAFAVAAVILLIELRKAKGAKTTKEKLRFVVTTTIIMSVIIAWIDYTPFLVK